MPLYDRQCLVCETQFEVRCSFTQKTPDTDKFPCPNCDSVDGTWMLSAPAFTMNGQNMGNSDRKTGFKDVLAKIANNYPRSELAKR